VNRAEKKRRCKIQPFNLQQIKIFCSNINITYIIQLNGLSFLTARPIRENSDENDAKKSLEVHILYKHDHS
jgi:hypothetical protein